MQETLPTKRTALEPPKRWRNRYWLHRRIDVNGERRGPGLYVSKFVWPSRDVAESIAEQKRPEWEQIPADYLGAEPEQ